MSTILALFDGSHSRVVAVAPGQKLTPAGTVRGVFTSLHARRGTSANFLWLQYSTVPVQGIRFAAR